MDILRTLGWLIQVCTHETTFRFSRYKKCKLADVIVRLLPPSPVITKLGRGMLARFCKCDTVTSRFLELLLGRAAVSTYTWQ